MLESIPLRLINSYRQKFGGGHSSAMVGNAFENEGFVAGCKKFLDVSETHALMILNESNLPHARIPEFTAMMLLLNPVVAVLVTHTSTETLGLAIAKNPILQAAWGASSSVSTMHVYDKGVSGEQVVQQVNEVAKKYGGTIVTNDITSNLSKDQGRTAVERYEKYKK